MSAIHPTSLPPELLKALSRKGLYFPVSKLIGELFDEFSDSNTVTRTKITLSKFPYCDLYCELYDLEDYFKVIASLIDKKTFEKFLLALAKLNNPSGRLLFITWALEKVYSSLCNEISPWIGTALRKYGEPTFDDHKKLYGNDLGFLEFWAEHRDFRDLTDHYGNRDLLKIAVGKNYRVFELAPAEIKKDRDYVDEVSLINPFIFRFCSITLRSDEAFVYKLAARHICILHGAAPQLFKKYGLTRHDWEHGQFNELWEALKIVHSKTTIETAIAPRIESVEAVQERKKLNRTL